jgi:uncharacterized membrane protein YbaN (DUF454 family)
MAGHFDNNKWDRIKRLAMIEPGKAMYQILGFLFLGVAMLGFVLPVLPGTPFLLVSAWFFARSSEKWHQWLLASELFGPIIHNWEAHRCISRRTKIVAIASMIIAGGASITFGVEDIRIRLLAAALMAIGTVTVLSIKTCTADADASV